MKKLSMVIMMLATGLMLCGGCQTATPSKAQSAEINADTITVTSGGAGFAQLLAAYTNLPPDNFVMVVEALAGLAGASECNVISQAMANETGGDESNSQTASGPETPVKVSVPTGTDAITALVGAGANGITEGLRENKNAEQAEVCASGDCAPAP